MFFSNENKYPVDAFMERFPDAVDLDCPFGCIAASSEASENESAVPRYVLTVDYTVRPPLVIRGIYDKYGLSQNRNDLPVNVNRLILYLNNNEIPDDDWDSGRIRRESDLVFC